MFLFKRKRRREIEEIGGPWTSASLCDCGFFHFAGDLDRREMKRNPRHVQAQEICRYVPLHKPLLTCRRHQTRPLVRCFPFVPGLIWTHQKLRSAAFWVSALEQVRGQGTNEAVRKLWRIGQGLCHWLGIPPISSGLLGVVWVPGKHRQAQELANAGLASRFVVLCRVVYIVRPGTGYQDSSCYWRCVFDTQALT